MPGQGEQVTAEGSHLLLQGLVEVLMELTVARRRHGKLLATDDVVLRCGVVWCGETGRRHTYVTFGNWH